MWIEIYKPTKHPFYLGYRHEINERVCIWCVCVRSELNEINSAHCLLDNPKLACYILGFHWGEYEYHSLSKCAAV
jgi:hypothetical protein